MRDPEGTIEAMPEEIQREYFHLLKSDVCNPLMAQLTQPIPNYLSPNPEHCIVSVEGKLPKQPEIINYAKIKQLRDEVKLEEDMKAPDGEENNDENEETNENESENDSKTKDGKKGKKDKNKKGKDGKDGKDAKNKGKGKDKEKDKEKNEKDKTKGKGKGKDKGKDDKSVETEEKEEPKTPRGILKNSNSSASLARGESALSMKMVAASVSFAKEDENGNIIHQLPGGDVAVDGSRPGIVSTLSTTSENDPVAMEKRRSLLMNYGSNAPPGLKHLPRIDYNNVPPVNKPPEEAIPQGVLPHGATTTRIGELLESFKDCQLLAEQHAIVTSLETQYKLYRYAIEFQDGIEWFDPPISSDSTRLWQEEAKLELKKIEKEEDRIRKGWELTYQQCVRDIEKLQSELDYRKNVIKQVQLYNRWLSEKLAEIHKDVQKKREELHLHAQKREKYLVNAKRAQQDEHRLRTRIETALRTQTNKTREVARLRALLGEAQWKVNHAPRHYEKHQMTRLGIFHARDEIDSKLQSELKVHRRWESWYEKFSKFEKYLRKYAELKMGGKTWTKYKQLWRECVILPIEKEFDNVEKQIDQKDISNLKYVGVSAKSHRNTFDPLRYMRAEKLDMGNKKSAKEYYDNDPGMPVEIDYPKDVVYDRFLVRPAPKVRRQHVYEDPELQEKIRVDFARQEQKHERAKQALVDVHGNRMQAKKRGSGMYFIFGIFFDIVHIHITFCFVLLDNNYHDLHYSIW